MKYFVFPLLASTLLAPQARAEKASINLCYMSFREELATATTLTAQRLGYFEKNGLDVNLVKESFPIDRETIDKALESSNVGGDAAARINIFNPRNRKVDYVEIQISRLLAAGKCDMASVSFETLLASNVDLDKTRPIGGYLYGGEYDTSLLVAKDSPIRSVRELKGKTIRVGQVTGLVILKNLLMQNGMTLDDVKVVTGGDILKRFRDKEIDAAISWNPTNALLLASGEVQALDDAIIAKTIKSFPHSLIVANADFYRNNSGLVKKFEKSFQEAGRFLAENPDEVVKALGGDQGVDRDYSAYTPVMIQRSTSFMKVSPPLIFGERDGAGSAGGQARIARSFTNLQDGIYDVAYISKRVNLDRFLENL